jgi:hypothetical protein
LYTPLQTLHTVVCVHMENVCAHMLTPTKSFHNLQSLFTTCLTDSPKGEESEKEKEMVKR